MKHILSVLLIMSLLERLSSDFDCPSAVWSKFLEGTKCYNLNESLRNYEQGEAYCHSHNAIVATILNAATQAWMDEFNDFIRVQAYLGLRPDENENMVWTDGTPLDDTSYTNWGTDSSKAQRDEIEGGCVIAYDKHWSYTDSCLFPRATLCEIRFATQTTNPTANKGCSTNNGGCDGKCQMVDGVKRCSCDPPALLLNSTKCFVPNPCKVLNGGCDHICKAAKDGTSLCTCINGFELEDEKRCKDIDECAINNGDCEQNCTNIPGGRNCSCAEDKKAYGIHCLDNVPFVDDVTFLLYTVGTMCLLGIGVGIWMYVKRKKPPEQPPILEIQRRQSSIGLKTAASEKTFWGSTSDGDNSFSSSSNSNGRDNDNDNDDDDDDDDDEDDD